MLKYLRNAALALALASGAPALAQSPAPAAPESAREIAGLSLDRLARLPAVLQAAIERGRIPGAVVLVARDGKVALFEAVGFRDKAANAPMAKDAIFRIYSMTKPITSVGVMMLVEEGRVLLADPISKHLPELKGMRVGIEKPGADGKHALELVPALREMTVQDLLRHTSGLAYPTRRYPLIREAYIAVRPLDRDQTMAGMLAKIATLPLAHQPGTTWEYSISTDVLGALIERVSGRTLEEFVAARITKPLGMNDTGFVVPEPKHGRIAEPLPLDPDSKQRIQLIDVTKPVRFYSAGGAMVSTAADYLRFCQMLLNGGTLDGVRLLGRKTVEYMTSDHLPAIARTPDYFPGYGYGFGLGFAVRTEAGVDDTPGSVGDYYWSGYASTFFWVDPKERLIGVFMTQAPNAVDHYASLMRNIVYGAVLR
jgi:CubicO group peptidase (beta-lactamase class C family)